MHSFPSASDELEAIGTLLLSDLDKCTASLNEPSEDEQFQRRQFVRVVFAFIEGLAYGMRQAALGFYADGFHEFSAGELALLQEQAWDLDENGAVRMRSANFPFSHGLRFSFMALDRSIGNRFTPFYSDNGWESLRKGSKVRNRLMHPKSTLELTVSDDDIECILQGLNWFQRNAARMLRAVADTAEERASPRRAQ